MSRIGKLPIKIPDGVQVKLEGNNVDVTGPKGNLSHQVNPGISITIVDEGVVVSCKKENDRVQRALWGLNRSLVANMILGVSTGFNCDLEVMGVGYRAEVVGKEIVMNVGYSHPVHVPIPDDVQVSVEKNVRIKVVGIDKQKVGQVAADIRRVKIPDPYKVKGVKYANEQIRRKVGKAGA